MKTILTTHLVPGTIISPMSNIREMITLAIIKTVVDREPATKFYFLTLDGDTLNHEFIFEHEVYLIKKWNGPEDLLDE
ncbi:MAG: hypothetical protein PHW40_08275 [Candidatus Izemoplasmatales bacterium]|nr:hypothetical protein [Candidatus Izemoplasmatales bacterium]